MAFLAPALDERAGGISAMVAGLRANLQDDRVAETEAFAPAKQRRVGQLFGRSTGRLVRAVLQFEPEIVHTNGLWAGQARAGAALARRHGLPEIVSPHGMLDPWAWKHRRWKKTIAWHWFERAHLARARAIHALGVAEAEAIRARGVTVPVATIPNGVDLPEARPEEPPPWVDVFGPEAKVVLFLGRINPKKGVDSLIRAWARLPRELVENGWRLAIAGWDDGGHENHGRNLMREGRIENSCALLGPLFDRRKAAALAGARAFILPSHSEGLPVAVLEAWAHGLPVLMTRACHLPEGFAAGAAVEIAAAPDRLSQQLAGFLRKSEAEHRRMGAAGRWLVEERFSWKTVGRQYLELYRWVAGKGERPAFVTVD